MRLDLGLDLEKVRASALRDVRHQADVEREVLMPPGRRHSMVEAYHQACAVLAGQPGPSDWIEAEMMAHAEAGQPIEAPQAARLLMAPYMVWMAGETAIHRALRGAELRIKAASRVRDIQVIARDIQWPSQQGAAR